MRSALNSPQHEEGLGSRIRQRFSQSGGAELELPSRSDMLGDPGFDAEAAIHYATQATGSEKSGQQIHMADAQIAAICLHHGAVLATRNTRYFEILGVELINPWGRTDMAQRC